MENINFNLSDSSFSKFKFVKVWKLHMLATKLKTTLHHTHNNPSGKQYTTNAMPCTCHVSLTLYGAPSYSTHSPLSIIPLIKRINSNSNLLIQPIPTPLLTHRHKRPIRAALQRNTDARLLLTDSLDIIELDIPLHSQLLGLDHEDAAVCEHDHHILTGQLEVGDVVFVEVLAVIDGLEPELAEGLALGVRADDAVEWGEAGQADAIEALGVEDGGGVADTFGHIC